MRGFTGICLGVLLCLATVGFADERRGSPFGTDEHWQGYHTYRPERHRSWRERDLPDRFTIDKPGTREVRCEREGSRYTCKEYRC
jgi:hypothetical protein